MLLYSNVMPKNDNLPENHFNDRVKVWWICSQLIMWYTTSKLTVLCFTDIWNTNSIFWYLLSIQGKIYHSYFYFPLRVFEEKTFILTSSSSHQCKMCWKMFDGNRSICSPCYYNFLLVWQSNHSRFTVTTTADKIR